ncbi:hypothetical protein GobsT_09410 [Gemmata obscuriglobus]|uniref:DUF885 domain-containing protein n=1 Tax=Gemmata obscuriglobus TaxID=114 RepID=A0A2Z3HFH1_9BACT|nr:hypothetical protein [Gemmata obscuriglobus]AWM40544.1 hypothetical protein C1280_28555 [Gemmata obscuriglobus]QEG26202.1 hypothetical protein GobsT_09410 [Gemmata obscuriglobus]VTS00894.1 unnamed protein product [Gemmata obscuriglobus UQM 2246]
MRTSAKRVLFAVLCVTFATSGVRAGDEKKPDATPKADDAAWLPPLTAFRADRHDSRRDIRVPPSMFPDLVFTPAEWDGKEDVEVFWKRRAAAFNELCPRLLGKAVLKIEPTDDALRKLLKAHTHQLILEYQEHLKPIEGRPLSDAGRPGVNLLEIQSTLAELLREQPKELVPWLEELIVAAKQFERFTRLRVEVGSLRPPEVMSMTRVRLQLELVLWRAKNPQAEPSKTQPTTAREKAVPAEGDWIAGTKVPPTLFPDIVPPVVAGVLGNSGWSSFAFARRMARYTDRCPRLFGVVALKIEPTDDTARKLLKARLHQGTLQFQLPQWNQHSGPDPNSFVLDANCLLDIQAAATELWAEQPKELVPWLEELLVAAKDQEQYTQRRVEAGAYKPQLLNYATQTRLKIEMGLWKAKNAK